MQPVYWAPPPVGAVPATGTPAPTGATAAAATGTAPYQQVLYSDTELLPHSKPEFLLIKLIDCGLGGRCVVMEGPPNAVVTHRGGIHGDPVTAQHHGTRAIWYLAWTNFTKQNCTTLLTDQSARPPYTTVASQSSHATRQCKWMFVFGKRTFQLVTKRPSSSSKLQPIRSQI